MGTLKFLFWNIDKQENRIFHDYRNKIKILRPNGEELAKNFNYPGYGETKKNNGSQTGDFYTFGYSFDDVISNCFLSGTNGTTTGCDKYIGVWQVFIYKPTAFLSTQNDCSSDSFKNVESKLGMRLKIVQNKIFAPQGGSPWSGTIYAPAVGSKDITTSNQEIGVDIQIGDTLLIPVNKNSSLATEILSKVSVELNGNAKYFIPSTSGTGHVLPSQNLGKGVWLTGIANKKHIPNTMPTQFYKTSNQWENSGTWTFGGPSYQGTTVPGNRLAPMDKLPVVSGSRWGKQSLDYGQVQSGKAAFTYPHNWIVVSPYVGDGSDSGRGPGGHGYDWGQQGPDIATTVRVSWEELPTLTANTKSEIKLDELTTSGSWYKLYKMKIPYDFGYLVPQMTAKMNAYDPSGPDADAMKYINVQTFAMKSIYQNNPAGDSLIGVGNIEAGTQLNAQNLDGGLGYIGGGPGEPLCYKGYCVPQQNSRLSAGANWGDVDCAFDVYANVDGRQCAPPVPGVILNDRMPTNSTMKDLTVIVAFSVTDDWIVQGNPNYPWLDRGVRLGGGDCFSNADCNGRGTCEFNAYVKNTYLDGNNEKRVGVCRCSSTIGWGPNCEYPDSSGDPNQYQKRGKSAGALVIDVSFTPIVEHFDDIAECSSNNQCLYNVGNDRTVAGRSMNKKGLSGRAPLCITNFRSSYAPPSASRQPAAICAECTKDNDCGEDHFCMTATRSAHYQTDFAIYKMTGSFFWTFPRQWMGLLLGQDPMMGSKLSDYYRNQFGKCVPKDFSNLHKPCRTDLKIDYKNSHLHTDFVECGQWLYAPKNLPNGSSAYNSYFSTVQVVNAGVAGTFTSNKGRSVDYQGEMKADTVWVGTCRRNRCLECDSDDGVPAAEPLPMSDDNSARYPKGRVCYNGKLYDKAYLSSSMAVTSTALFLIVFADSIGVLNGGGSFPTRRS
eukprot:g3951.t1